MLSQHPSGLSTSLCDSGPCHPFAQAAFLLEGRLQLPELAVEKVGRDFNQADQDIGGDGRIGMLDTPAKGIIRGVRLAVERSKAAGVSMLLRPLGHTPDPEKITIVFEQLLETRPRDVEFPWWCPRRGCLR